jgi:hypothetical protein
LHNYAKNPQAQQAPRGYYRKKRADKSTPLHISGEMVREVLSLHETIGAGPYIPVRYTLPLLQNIIKYSWFILFSVLLPVTKH